MTTRKKALVAILATATVQFVAHAITGLPFATDSYNALSPIDNGAIIVYVIATIQLIAPRFGR